LIEPTNLAKRENKFQTRPNQIDQSRAEPGLDRTDQSGEEAERVPDQLRNLIGPNQRDQSKTELGLDR
jgi:hypothetical protein